MFDTETASAQPEVCDKPSLRPPCPSPRKGADPRPRDAMENDTSPNSGLVEVLDHLDHGILMFTTTRQLLHANRAAQRECDIHPCLQIAEGRLSGRRPSDALHLVRAIQDATKGIRSLVCFDDEPRALAVAVLPLRTSTDRPASTPRFLAVMAKRASTEPSTMCLFSRAHRLTAAESEVLKGLSGGADPAELAHNLGVTLNTLRTHITNIRQKTGTPHLRALLAKVHNLPPMVCANQSLRWD